MRDDYLTADWARHHHSLFRSLAGVFDVLRDTVARLHAQRFEAPWHDGSRRAPTPQQTRRR